MSLPLSCFTAAELSVCWRMYYLRVCPLMAMIKAYLHLNLLFRQEGEGRKRDDIDEGVSFGRSLAATARHCLSLPVISLSLSRIELFALTVCPLKFVINHQS